MATKNELTTYKDHEPQTATQQRVIAAFVELGGGWHTGKDIAAALGRKKLYPSDRGVLARLVADGVLELRHQPASATALIERYEYRVVGQLPEIRSKGEE